MNPCRRLIAAPTLLVFSFLFWAKATGRARSQTTSGSDLTFRIEVAHAHPEAASWCRGYLVISTSGMRYEVRYPDKDKAHSFDVKWSEVPNLDWSTMLAVQQSKAVQLVAAGKKYYFWLIQGAAALHLDDPQLKWTPDNAGSATSLAVLIQASYKRAVPSGTLATDPLSASPAAPSAVQAPPTTASALDEKPADAVYGALHVDAGTRDKRFLVVSQDGWVSTVVPEAGLDGWSLSLAQQKGAVAASLLGRYRAGPDTFEIDWAGPGGYHQSLRRNEKLAAFSELETYIPMCRCNGVHFSGIYELGAFRLQFFPNGTFTDTGAIGYIIGEPGRPQPGGVGTYMLQNYTFHFRYNDGRQGRRAFLAPANEQPTGSFLWIQIGLEMNRVSP